jgi:mercuric transport protein
VLPHLTEMRRSAAPVYARNMRRLALVSTLLILAAVSFAAADQQPTTVTLSISGMHCEGCASGIAAMLKRTDGVVKADVSYDERRAIVDYDAAKTSPEKIVEAIEKLGYKAAVKKS